MNPSLQASSITPSKPTFACIRCSQRKVKCDKQEPCNTCVRHNVQCVFSPPKTSRKKRKLKEHEAVKNYEQFRRLERPVMGQGTTLEAERQSGPQRMTETSSLSEPQAAFFKPQLLHGQKGTKLVNNSLWSRVAEEIHDTEEVLEEDSANNTSDGGTSNDDFAYVLGWKVPVTTSSHPSAEVIHQLWQTFIENVNPLTKLVHVPSLQPAIEKAISSIDRIPRGFEALMFAMYSMAILSLKEDECKGLVGETRTILLPRYVAATKVALSRARFMSSNSILVLQALVLHILSIRDFYEPRALWSLTGVAIRNAESLGLRLDGTLLGLSPFETEIRRRIWWQLKMHDFRAAELCGQTKFRGFELNDTTPKRPANVNDSDLWPAMPQAPAESAKPTEMIWCMLRTELVSFATTQTARINKQGKRMFTTEEFSAMNDLKIKDVFIKELEDNIETKYLRFCDPSQPLHLMTLLGARMSLNLIRFLAHHPRRWASLDKVPRSEQDFVWNAVIQLLEQYNMMQSSPQLRCLAWNVPYFIQWQAVIHILDTLRANALHEDAVKAWRLIDALYKHNSDILLSVKKPIFAAVGNLCLKAFNARVTALKKEKRSLSDPPDYITKLRELREAAKARREAMITRIKGQESLDNGKKISTTTHAEATWPNANLGSAEALVEAQPQQYRVTTQQANPVLGTTRNEDDAFWLNNIVQDGTLTDGADMFDLNMDANPTQYYWFDTPNSDKVIDWAQWDALLGNVDLIDLDIGG